jgi:hypothetical protein
MKLAMWIRERRLQFSLNANAVGKIDKPSSSKNLVWRGEDVANLSLR